MSGRSTRCDSNDLLDDLVVLTETYLSPANGSWPASQTLTIGGKPKLETINNELKPKVRESPKIKNILLTVVWSNKQLHTKDGWNISKRSLNIFCQRELVFVCAN